MRLPFLQLPMETVEQVAPELAEVLGVNLAEAVGSCAILVSIVLARCPDGVAPSSAPPLTGTAASTLEARLGWKGPGREPGMWLAAARNAGLVDILPGGDVRVLGLERYDKAFEEAERGRRRKAEWREKRKDTTRHVPAPASGTSGPSPSCPRDVTGTAWPCLGDAPGQTQTQTQTQTQEKELTLSRPPARGSAVVGPGQASGDDYVAFLRHIQDEHGALGHPPPDDFRPVYGKWVAELVQQGAAADYTAAARLLREGYARFRTDAYWEPVWPWAGWAKQALSYATNTQPNRRPAAMDLSGRATGASDTRPAPLPATPATATWQRLLDALRGTGAGYLASFAAAKIIAVETNGSTLRLQAVDRVAAPWLSDYTGRTPGFSGLCATLGIAAVEFWAAEAAGAEAA